MRDWNAWLGPLKRGFRKFKNLPLDDHDLDQLIRVEYCLRLHEHLIPQLSCLETWALLTGYQIEGISDTPRAQRICSIARHRVRFLRTANSWETWLDWYATLDEGVRLYDVDLTSGQSNRRSVCPVLPERIDHYDHALEEPAPHRHREVTWASSGTYHFNVRGETLSVQITEKIAELADSGSIHQSMPPRSKREPIKVSLQQLRVAAAEMAQVDPDGDWIRRSEAISLALIREDLELDATAFDIDGIFHLLGMVGAGKSTLIQILIYHLVQERGLHVSIIVNTVVDAIDMAATLRRLGIPAAPALGTDRAQHRIKYGQAKRENLLPEDSFLPTANLDPALDWLTGPCILSGALTEDGPIPAGSEPCNALYDAEGKRYACPVRPVCPIHQASHDLAASKVWVVNPASFIQSRAPESLTSDDMRLLEAVYRTSDLLIIDEVDRVQVQWDHKYAPINDLAGHRAALLDHLHLIIAEQSAQQGRRHLKHRRNNELILLDSEANRLSSWLFHLLLNNTDLVDWIGRHPLTNSTMYSLLADVFSKPNTDGEIDPAIRERLFGEFDRFFRNPTNREGGGLAELVNDVRSQEENLHAQLLTWLQPYLPWIVDEMAVKRARRLEFAVLLTALDKRVDALLRNWLWAAYEFGQQQTLEQSPPEEYVDLVPESPLGNLLGYQYVQRDIGGILKYVQCHGIGRWLINNLPHLYADVDGSSGPHLFITSATSWAPGSPQYHLAVSPNALLLPPEAERLAIEQSRFDFMPIQASNGKNIVVSGVEGETRKENLRRLVRSLAISDNGHPSILDQELNHWAEQGAERRILLLVGSYIEVKEAVSALNEVPGWKGRALGVFPDTDESIESWIIKRGDVEGFGGKTQSILVAPLLAIQRGFNILDDSGGALLGTAFFLVRPYPVPDDLGQHVIGVNYWAMSNLAGEQSRCLPSADNCPTTAIRSFRQAAFAEWRRRLEAGEYGMQGLADDLYNNFLWDQFVAVWQTIGRLVRRGRETRVYFVDGAFHSSQGKRSMLRDWATILGTYLDPNTKASSLEQQIAQMLYSPAYKALKDLADRL